MALSKYVPGKQRSTARTPEVTERLPGAEPCGTAPAVALSETDLAQLRLARGYLESPRFAARLSQLIGAPLESGMQALPESITGRVDELVQNALLKAAEAAVYTLEDAPGQAASERWHKLGVTLTGGVGGFFGASGWMAELPVSTTMMLRSIADIARSEGESITDPQTRLACLEVFALGGPGSADNAAETGYFAVRSALAKYLTDAAEHLARHGLNQAMGPVLTRFLAHVARYFGVQASQKLAAQAVPAIGAAGGAAINALFMDHFQTVARGHFIVRRLERRYDPARVREAYEALADPDA